MDDNNLSDRINDDTDVKDDKPVKKGIKITEEYIKNLFSQEKIEDLAKTQGTSKEYVLAYIRTIARILEEKNAYFEEEKDS